MSREPVIAKDSSPASAIRPIEAVWELMKNTFVNGKARGTTTHFKQFDTNFTWKTGEITLVIGVPNAGKTEFVLQLMLMKSHFDGWKWGCFSPENYPEDEFYDTLIHAYIGKTTDPYLKEHQMSMSDYQRGYEFVKKHFFYVYPEEQTPEQVGKVFEWLIEKHKINGTLTDPFNQLETEYEGRDDLFLSKYLRDKKRFAVTHNICDITTAHPKVLRRDKDGKFPVPEIYDIAGGAMWGNKMDNIMVIDRPNIKTDPFDSNVNVIVRKIKKQRLVGIPGICNFTFNRKFNRYYIDDENPLDGGVKIMQTPKRLFEKKKEEQQSEIEFDESYKERYDVKPTDPF